MRELAPHEVVQRTINQAINQLIRGRVNSVGSLTLEANEATTTITPDVRISNSGAKIFLTPRTANAAAELAAGTLYISEITRTNFTVTHANNAQTDRTFDYDVRGG